MSTDAATTIATPEATRDQWMDLVCDSDYRQLLNEFHDCIFHTIFVRNNNGFEGPYLIQDGRYPTFAGTPDEQEAKNALETLSATAEGELFLEPVELSHLARSAREHQVDLRWLGHMGIGATPIWCLGTTAIVVDRNGEEIAYESHAYHFEDGTAQEAPPYGALQQWCTCDPTLSDEIYDDMECFRVYDDLLDWNSNPWMPDIPTDAIPLSSLSDSAEAFFRRTQRPLLPINCLKDAPEKESVPAIPDRQLVPNRLLGDFARWRHHVSESLIPDAKACKLIISQDPAEPRDTSPSQVQADRRFIELKLPDQYGKLLSEAVPVDAAMLKESSQLSSDTGRHKVTPAFRDYLVNQVAWAMFHHARRLWPGFSLAPEVLRAMFPAKPLNAYEVFTPDYGDTRFPCLARIPCQDLDLPVLLLGQVRGNYICQTLYHAPIPGDALPAMLKGKDKLLTDGQLVFEDTRSTILIPANLVDFPEHWYTGARAPVDFHAQSMAMEMEFNHYRRYGKDSEKPQPKPNPLTPSALKITITVLAIIGFLAVLAFM